MKQLVISIQSPRDTLEQFGKALEKARAGKLKPYFGIAFDNRKSFNRFIKNAHVLSSIREHKPRSIYELAKKSGVDVSNLNKIILFFEQVGAVKMLDEVFRGRKTRRPVVDYDRIEFRLAS